MVFTYCYVFSKPLTMIWAASARLDIVHVTASLNNSILKAELQEKKK